MKLTNKLIKDASIFLVIISLPAYFLAYSYSLRQSQKDRENSLKNRIHQIQPVLTDALWIGNYHTVKQILETLTYDMQIIGVDLFEEDMKNVPLGIKGELSAFRPIEQNIVTQLRNSLKEKDAMLFEIDPKNSKASFTIHLSKINLGNIEKVGFLQIRYSYEDLQKQAMTNALMILGLLVMILVLLLFFIYLYLKKFIIRPLSSLEWAMSNMDLTGDIRLPIQADHVFELASLTETFNKMGEHLQDSANIITNQQVQIINISKLSTLGEMAAGIAHEINNPLMVTKGHLEKIQRAITQDEEKFSDIKVSTEKAMNGVHRVAKIITGLRSVARNAAGDPMVSTPLEKIISETLELCIQRFKHGEVELKIPQNIKCSISCRESQISQVLLNLLNNAFDAVSELPNINKWVSLEVDETQIANNKVVIRLIDCGSGIPVDVAKKMLEPFYTTKASGKGTGLGLSISVGIIESHQGKLYLDANCTNTCFVIELPIA